MASILPKKKAYPLYKAYLEQMFQSQVNDVLEGAFLVLGNLSEGCPDYVRRDLGHFVKNFVEVGLAHQNIDIRRATCYCINYMAQYIQPEIIIFHKHILPGLINSLSDYNSESLKPTVLSLEIFC